MILAFLVYMLFENLYDILNVEIEKKQAVYYENSNPINIKEIVEENECGITVKPNDIQEIRNAIQYILNNPEEAKTMGTNGRKAVENKYNWASEEKKIFDVYSKFF